MTCSKSLIRPTADIDHRQIGRHRKGFRASSEPTHELHRPTSRVGLTSNSKKPSTLHRDGCQHSIFCIFDDGFYRFGTERDSNSPTAAVSTDYGIRKREYCYEEGTARGADLFSAERNHTPVNARHREIGRRAFRVLGQFWQGFATNPPAASRSLFRERTSGVRKGPSRFLPDPGISAQNSRNL
jgi:hypothetical protein